MPFGSATAFHWSRQGDMVLVDFPGVSRYPGCEVRLSLVEPKSGRFVLRGSGGKSSGAWSTEYTLDLELLAEESESGKDYRRIEHIE